MSKDMPGSILVTVSGQDQPGITSELVAILARRNIAILDIAQAVIQPLLSLSLLIGRGPGTSDGEMEATVGELTERARALGMKLQSQTVWHPVGAEAPAEKPFHYAVTLIADPVTAQALADVTAALARHRINIDVIKRLSESSFGCVELGTSSAAQVDRRSLRKELLGIAHARGVDIALQAEGLYRRAKRLVVMDMDSTLIQAEVIDELAREKGVYDEVAAITHEAMLGRMAYDESLARRCEKLAGLPAEALERVYQRIQLTPGAEELIRVVKKLGFKIAILSGGFTFVADRLKEKLGIDFAYANVLEVRDGVVTGRVHPPIVNAQRKADLLDVIAQQEKIELDQVVAIGDGANDLLMLAKAGLGIAFNAKPAVREEADLSVSQKNMRAILYLLGLSGRELAQLKLG